MAVSTQPCPLTCKTTETAMRLSYTEMTLHNSEELSRLKVSI